MTQDKIKQIIKEKIAPIAKGHGGDVELVNFDENTGVVEVKLKGACDGCPLSAITLKAGLESQLKKVIPQVTEVRAI